MCGIVGYIGNEDARDILLKGLSNLEYRGYDSAGIALLNDDGVHVFKEKGRIAVLRNSVDPAVHATLGIGHTRWATHGQPNKRNAHPHQSASGRFTLVHNGVIENYAQLKADYLTGVTLKSETDTEVVVQLIEKFADQGLGTEEALRKTLKLLDGSYAFALVDAKDDATLYVAKNKSPLLIGLGEGFNVVASDATAMIQKTKRYVELMDEEIVILKRDSYTIKDLDGTVTTRKPYTVSFDANDTEKGAYPHYMLKEIDEQPAVMRRLLQEYSSTDGKITLDPTITSAINDADRIYIIACGTSYHAGLAGKHLLETVAGIPTEVHISSEFSYNMPLLSKKPLFIFISQSGETADSRAVLVKVKKLGYPTLTMTNVEGSTLYREADHKMLLFAGPEIAVASTKAYTAMIAVFAFMSVAAAQKKGTKLGFDLVHELSLAAQGMEQMIDEKAQLKEVAREYLSITRNAFYIGRALDYYVCMEAALKLKEVSYIQAEGFAGGELKHGTIALIEEGTPVFAYATQQKVNNSIRSNVEEVAARGAHTCIISMDGVTNQKGDRIVLPNVHPVLAPLVCAVPLQLIAYYAALQNECDVDKPRNLAKSVTVE
ncbi:glutamine--fructose-6-phosphate transaminase (isomerizing) [Sporolactobacillus terrae]|uniref:Glutamine--fructose-6-phosphate aminotransferase [isomerizing] n=1 Tax=Sporolactobacillus terrae TaxID=269673 RepID=A0A410D5I6_9BACL|nr:glutamine--fructose-6-phosphate transaminase (isomerizing) [Sporolactobacillus terrae]QAA21360.1 glutamine--fructose-6-phosphate transaminase (isomerizing) [Sporolactobacillus terrae]QAA24332.1 glutamine--fructose-6-phosphate transaminase (isomerizing) [Sporolactobacillus terrae]UAK16153.1 glutamine--fructose-6-phosphate transaminase (isomerizing) [Sporolactobacillus terrae]BBN97578.1 glutamine--fructose-6-phosphate aminotransferase [isomerizing] [Sporolactobacillus terrae]